MPRNSLVLTQLRESSEYNDFVGQFYHFPDKYEGQFKALPIEFVYYEGTEHGEGVYFGYGKIVSPPAKDKREPGYSFAEVIDYKPFLEPVRFRDGNGKSREAASPHYNPRNAVRRISPEILDEICLDGKIRLNFRADAHLIRVLGEQLIASEKVGVLELIKNAYDAGASYCRVRIENVPTLLAFDKAQYLFPELPGPVLVIEDDGSGMTRDVIEYGWLRPASTIKTVVKETIKQERAKAVAEGKLGSYNRLIAEIKKERGGRIPLGEKGVGRFASHRLGRRLLLKTKVKELDYEYILEVDWDTFEAGESGIQDLETVGVSLTRQAPSRDYGGKGSGTQLVIYGGREGFSWDQKTIEDLQRSIVSLNSPNPSPKSLGNGKGFRAFLECPQIGVLSIDKTASAFPPTFSFDGLVDESGILEYTLKFQPPKNVPMPREESSEKNFDLRKANIGYWSRTGADGLREPECGSFYLHLDVWYRKSPWIASTGPDGKEFIEYLTNFGGISIYRDEINIFPAEWGAETDWLSLSKRHIKQGFRMSYYNMIGNLEINQATNVELIDKTNREGLIANRASKDLTQLVHAIVSTVIETKFIAKREEYDDLTGDVVRDPKALTNYAKQGAAVMKEIKERYPVDEDPYKILDPLGKRGEREQGLVNLSSSLKNLQKSIGLIQEAQDLFTEQAGYGMAVAVSIHEIAKIAGNFYAGVSHLLKSDDPDVESLNNLKKASASLQSELRRLSPLRAIKSESETEFGVMKAIGFAVEVFRSRFEKAGIVIEVNGKENFKVYARYGALIQIFSNLFDNSCYWLGMVARSKRRIKIQIEPKHRTIIVADSGPGIDAVILPYLFQPGYSMRVPPSGLGLYICKYYMQSMRGNAYGTLERERIEGLTGAQFTLDFGSTPSERPVGAKK
ncbi:MAG TPA: sensor histidine kinase [Candidatus Acidoferrales bacterium]